MDFKTKKSKVEQDRAAEVGNKRNNSKGEQKDRAAAWNMKEE